MIRPSFLVGRHIGKSFEISLNNLLGFFFSTYLLLDVNIQSFILFYCIERFLKFWEAQDKYSLNI